MSPIHLFYIYIVVSREEIININKFILKNVLLLLL